MKTLIAVPCHDMVHANFMKCLVELDKPIGTSFAMVKNTLIYNARNTIANEAVKAGFDRVLWLDSDMTFLPDTLRRLSRDCDEGMEFVTGLCFTRKAPVTPCIDKEIHWTAKEDGWVDCGATSYFDYPRNQVFPIAGAGFACCMTTTGLLRRMIDKYGAPFYPLMGMGEDNSFCFRANELGEKLYCDSSIRVGHIGQYVFGESDYE